MKQTIKGPHRFKLETVAREVALDALLNYSNREFDANILARIERRLIDDCVIHEKLNREEVAFCRNVFRDTRQGIEEEELLCSR